MKTIICSLALIFLSSFALAQAQSPLPATPECQAVGTKLMEEINASIVARAAAITAQQEVAKLKTEVERLKDKYEPAKK